MFPAYSDSKIEPSALFSWDFPSLAVYSQLGLSSTAYSQVWLRCYLLRHHRNQPQSVALLCFIYPKKSTGCNLVVQSRLLITIPFRIAKLSSESLHVERGQFCRQVDLPVNATKDWNIVTAKKISSDKGIEAGPVRLRSNIAGRLV
jgi:hypothetical protein